jgi:hypothetical protein
MAGVAERFDDAARRDQVRRFVPASGAASRMFRQLQALDRADGGETAEPLSRRSLERRAAAEGTGGDAARALHLFDRLADLAFYEDLAAALATAGHDLRALLERGDLAPVLEGLLAPASDGGLGLAGRPKGLIPFHRYPGERRTAFDEHLVEAAATARAADGTCRAHFTVQPDHEAAFRARLAEVRPGFEERLGARFEVGFSHQSPSTDTLAVDPEGEPFRLDDGTLLLRPGGHGALLGNLAALAGGGSAGARLAVIKNIDNVVPDDGKPAVVRWKRLLGGTLLALRDTAFAHLERLERADGAELDAVLAEAERFLGERLGRPLPRRFAESPPAERRRAVADRLDRPLRVCGMVRNQGEPGGGPFWVGSAKGEVSLQIVEGSQVDPDAAEQQAILAAATHFNPVDVVCSLTDRRGRPYDLERFVDPDTVFLADKFHQGRPLVALERPGLWNGAMTGWNTAFVEVPVETFAPVKTVLDLLRRVHQTGVPPQL